MSIKAPSAKVVSFESFVQAKATAYDARVAANASAPLGETIRPHDAEARAARATGRIASQPLAKSATVIDMAYGPRAALIGALLAQDKDADALGVALLHAVETSKPLAHTPLVDDSHIFRMP